MPSGSPTRSVLINVVSVTEEVFRDQLIVTIWYREKNPSDSVGTPQKRSRTSETRDG